MKKFKKLIVLCSMACVMVAVSACSVWNDLFQDTLNKHDFAAEWTHDETSHWKACEDENCQEVDEKADHTYGEGVVTTPATEKAEGVMTYECTVCGYEKTEAIEKIHKHTWDSEWSTDETYHWYASTCGHDDKDKAEHDYDDGFVEKPATDTEEGVMIYTCIDCGYDYEDVIPMLNHKHAYSEEWTYDETAHWHATTCGHNLKKNKADHTYSGEGVVTKDPTEDEEGVTSYYCDTCDYEKKDPIAKLPHTHKFATEWSNDEDYHWYASLCGHDETLTKIPHDWDDGIVTQDPTEDADGVKTFTCGDCGKTYEIPVPALNHTHTFETEYSRDANYHWFVPTCGHEDAVVLIAHEYNADGDCVCGAHAVCSVCGGCLIDACADHETKCLFRNSNEIVTFAPQATYLGDPEGPDGLAPGTNGAYIYDTSIKASQVVLSDGAYATQVTLPNGTKAHSGVSFWNNQNVESSGQAGYNCAIPQYANVTKVVRMHFTNNGTSEITFRYSAIDYYYDKGAVEVTLAAGESKTVLLNVTYANNTVGLNHQIVFLKDAAAGASLTIWGEFIAEGLDKSISINVPADKTTFYVGDTFTAEGLVLKGSSSLIGNKVDSWNRVYISGNYVTDYDGVEFTADDCGENIPVTVTFAGKTCTYYINVIDHDTYQCEECGLCANQVCDYPDCDSENKCKGHFDADSMTVMSFNLGTNGVENQYNRANLLAKVSTELPDLLGTQEENSLWTAALTDTLAKYGYKNVIMYRDGAYSTSLSNEGTGIWYNSLRFTLNDWGYFWMSDTPDTTSIWSQYGALYKRVTTWAEFTDNVSGKSFVYYNTHIGYESSELWLRTADMIMERMHAHYNEGLPVIITGDFNFALNTEGALPAYERFMQGLNDSHYEALTKNYEEGKQNTFSNYGENAHTKPIDYILYSSEFIANTYTILREELPEGVTAPDRQYFSSDHFAIKTVFNFSEDWGTHICWEPCEDCGLCLDDDCELCEDKCPGGHHVCTDFCPDCGLCVNAKGDCEAEYCPQYKVTLVGAEFANGENVWKGCKLSPEIVVDSDKTFEGFIDESKNYYTVEDLADMELTANVKFTALYQEDMLAYAQSDTKAVAVDGISAKHILEEGVYKTQITYAAGTVSGSWFAGRGNKDSGVLTGNFYAPANGKNVGIIYIYNHESYDVKIQYMVENYGAQHEELIVTLKPGLNRIVLTFATASSYNVFTTCDHQIILLQDAGDDDIVLDTYGYIYVGEMVTGATFNVGSMKTSYAVGQTFENAGVSVTANCSNPTGNYKVTNYTTSLDGYVFTADDLGTKTVTVYWGAYSATFEIEVYDHNHELEFVDKVEPIPCEKDGTESYYRCTVGACGMLFDGADWITSNVIDAPETISCHVAGLTLPGTEILCANCSAPMGVKSMENWILYTPATRIHSTIGSTIGTIGLEYGTVNGAAGTYVTFAKDAVGSASNTSGFKFYCENDLSEDNGVIYQHKLPNVGTNVPNGSTRSLVMYFQNYGTEDVTLTFKNDGNSAVSITVTVPAGGIAIGETKMYKTGGYNYFDLCLNNTEALQSDVKIGMYGYIEILDGEINTPTIKQAANTTTFKVGDTFSAEGLVLQATLPNTYGRDIYAVTGYTTNLDGYVFTEEDLGTKTVTVSFAGKTTTYQITVVCAHDLEGVADKSATCTETGNVAYWYCKVCENLFLDEKGENATTLEEVTLAMKAHDTEVAYDDEGHWEECKNCDYASESVAHEPNAEGKCACGHQEVCEDKCDVCGECANVDCKLCETKCAFSDTNKVIPFAPQATYLGDPEGPDGLAPGADGAYIYDTSIQASQVVLENGAYATQVTLPNGAAAHSGVSFCNNKNIESSGQAGYNCAIPQVANVTKVVRMHFTNNGTSEISFRYSAIDYYYDKGGVDVTLAAGESKTVLMDVTFSKDSVGLNHQIVFLKDAAEGAALTIWGEFLVDENLTSISIATPAKRLNFGVGETFSAEGLVLKANGTNYSRVYVSGNYVTDLDGYEFTAKDVGTKKVVVIFADKVLSYEIKVYDHAHELEYVEEVEPIECATDGVAAHYICTVGGCGMYFADAMGNKVIDAPETISCHVESTAVVLPGDAILCENCSAPMGVKSMENWVYLNLTTQTSSIGSNIKNGKVEQAEVEGMPGTKFYVGAGTVGATNNSAFYLKMSDNDAGRQTVIPNLGSNAPSGGLRTVVLFYKNYSNEDITMNLQNDAQGGNGKVTVPANGTAICQFTIKNVGGSNWFYFYVDCSPSIDIVFGVYGYFYVHDGEVDTPTVSTAAKTTYRVGEAFTTDGLVLSARMPSSSGKEQTLYVQTGYTVDMEEGYVFTENDIGKHLVTVSFAGKTVKYQVEVVTDSDCENGVHVFEKVYDENLFVEMDGDDAIYHYACSNCGEVSEDTYAADKIAFVPHSNIGGGHKIEYVTLEDGRIAAKLTFTSDVAAGTTYTITANTYPSVTNVAFPVRTERRVYMEMTSSANVNITWQPEFYGDRDGMTFDLTANETQSASRTIQYTGTQTASALPYQEIVCNTAVSAGTVVYITGYFYTMDEVVDVNLKSVATKTTFKVGETFSSAGVALAVNAAESLYDNVSIYNVTTDLDGHVFTAEDLGVKTVTVKWGDLTCTYDIIVIG